jgi:hypothetical protein
MRRLLAFLLFAGAAFAQPTSTITTWFSNPSGVSCQSGSGALYALSGSLFTCQGGVFVQVTGAGGASIAPFMTDGMNVTLPTGTLSVGNTVLSEATLARLKPPHAAMVTIAIGNSITGLSQYGSGGISAWSVAGEIHLANALSGSPMIFSRMTATTRADAYGIYGYSGATLPTILTDLQAQLYAPLQTAGIVPDLVIGHALIDNDIAAVGVGGAAAAIAAQKSKLVEFVRDIHARYPKAILLLCTPHPSSSYDTVDKVSAYGAMRDYMLSLDDGKISSGARTNGSISIPAGVSIITARLDTYEDPANPGKPYPYLTSGFTDSTVHPSAKGALRNARVIAATLARISTSWLHPYYSISANMAFTGTASATGTNVSGTVPTGCAFAGAALSTILGTAEQPGWLMAITSNASGAEPPNDPGSDNMGQVLYTGGANTQLSPFVEIEIVSGAQNISSIQLQPRFYHNSTNTFLYYIQRQTNSGLSNGAGGVVTEPEWLNGDVLMLRQPPQVAPSGTFTAVTNWFKTLPVVGGGSFTVRLRSSGVQIVVP